MIQLFGKAVVEKATELIVVDYMGRSDMNNMQSLKRNWQKLSCKASDIEEEVNREEMSGKKKRKSEVDNWLKDVKRLSPEIDALETRGSSWRLPLKEDPVGKLQLQVEELVQESHHFNGLVLHDSDNIGEPFLPTKLFGVKFEEALERIRQCLAATGDVSNIGIYGMGGVGKTTLARNIEYEHSKKPNLFVRWVTVSQDFSITNLQDKIANVLGIPLSNKDEEEVRANMLRGAFKKVERLIVLILDDVWKEFCLDKVGIPVDARNCRLILTTRSREVCNRMRCQQIFYLKTLDTHDAWDLFKYKLGSETLLHGDLEDIAKSIAKRCAGLPLAIVTVAGSMRGVSDICEWRNALKQLEACSVGHDEMERDVFPILEWSFNRLNECPRQCFLYCSLYPEDSKIKRKELIDLFILADLMPKRNSRSEAFDQGHTILNKLIKVCLLEETIDFGGNECVKMHDLVRDMALRITNGNSNLNNVPRFLVKSLGWRRSEVILEQKEWTEDLHAISFHAFKYGSAEIEVPSAWSPNCPKLSTLLLPRFHIKRIPDSFFQHMCGLKVLNLSGCGGITELPNSVSYLVNLTALILAHCEGLQSLPPLGELKQLRELDLNWTKIEDFPQGLESLVSLERLDLGYCRDLQSLPPLGELKQLRELDLKATKIEDFPQGLESLVSLERLDLGYCSSLKRKIIPKGTFSEWHRLQWLELPLYGNVQVNDPEVLNQLETFIGCVCFTYLYKICRWPKHYYLYINDEINDDFSSFPDDDEDDDVGHHLLEDPKQLYFYHCNLGRGSNYPALGLPSDMKRLQVVECLGRGIRCLSDAFKNFTSLNDLSHLEIYRLNGIEFLWQFPSLAPRDQLVNSSFSLLRNLQYLTLQNLPDLLGLFFWESGAYLLPPGTFSSLRDLSIAGCHNVKQLFTVQLLQNLQNLEYLEVCYCGGLEEIAADDNGAGQGGGEGIQLTSSEATATVILPKLWGLCLNSLPQLKNIWKTALSCDSIMEIKISGCPKVKRLPLFLPTINGLPSPPNTHFRIWGDAEWWESLEWDNPYTKNALDPYFTKMVDFFV